MGWRDRAVVVNSQGSWKDRAVRVEPEEKGILQRAGEFIQKVDAAVPDRNDLTKTLEMPFNLAQRGAEEAGQFTAENLARGGVNPYVAAAVGTGMSFAPDILAAAATPTPKFDPSPNALREGGSYMFRKGAQGILGVPEEAQVARFRDPSVRVDTVPDFNKQSENLARIVTGLEKGVRQKASGFPTFNQVGQDIAAGLNDLKAQVSKLDDEAWNSLLKLKAEPRSKIVKFLKDAMKPFKIKGGGTVGQADKKAVGTLSGIIDDIKGITQKGIDPKLEQFLDQNQVRKIIQALDDNINWTDPLAGETNKALIDARMSISNYLKKENPDFAPILDDLAQRTKLLKEVADDFSMATVEGQFSPSNTTATKIKTSLGDSRVETGKRLKMFSDQTGINVRAQGERARFKEGFDQGKLNPRDAAFDKDLARDVRRVGRSQKAFNLERTGEGFLPTNTTSDALKRLGNEKTVGSRRILRDIDKGKASKILKDVEKRSLAEEFPKARTQGSKRTLAGTVMGTLLEPIIPGFGFGPVLGNIAGSMSDVYGGRATARLIDILSKIDKSGLGKFIAQRGGRPVPILKSSVGLGANRVLRDVNQDDLAMDILREAAGDAYRAREIFRARYPGTDLPE